MWRKLEHVSRCLTQKSVGVHGHTYVETLRRTAGRYDTSSSLSEKRIPTRTWPQSQVRSPSSPMPPFPPEVRWYGIWLSNVLAVRVLHDDVLQHRPANENHLIRVSLRFLFVGPTPGHFPLSGFLSTEGFELRSFCTYTSKEYFVIDGGYSERVPPASNAPRCGVLAAETKTAASSHQQSTT